MFTLRERIKSCLLLCGSIAINAVITASACTLIDDFLLQKH
jgi:hypothetical protein